MIIQKRTQGAEALVTIAISWMGITATLAAIVLQAEIEEKEI
jgi:hypothetical protein